MMQVPTPSKVITLPLAPEVVQINGDPDVKTTISKEEDVALTVKVSLE